jgi:hypothetical protein
VTPGLSSLQKEETRRIFLFHPILVLLKYKYFIFLSPPGERIKVRGKIENVKSRRISPSPCPLPSRERVC